MESKYVESEYKSSSPSSKQSQSQSKDYDESSSLSKLPEIEIESVEIQPEDDCALTDGFDLEVFFSLSDGVEDGVWEIKYLVDSMRNRHIITLGSTRPETYPSGPSSFYFSIPSINVSHIKPGNLTNAGLLSATLLTGGESGSGGGREVATINMVVQVKMDEDGALKRTIYNPLM